MSIFDAKPFWIWDTKEHNKLFEELDGECCFNHIVGLPEKNNKTYPIFDYQDLIYNAIEKHQNIWILKSRGIGLTTFMIRYLAWKILSTRELDFKSIFIISGTREEHANYIKEKLRSLFENKFPSLKLASKYTELTLKKTWIKVFPTNNIKGVRGYFESSFIWVDESDMFDDSVQAELLNVISPYEEKSNAKILLSSTPNKPDGLMQSIEKDPNSKYYKLKLPYQLGLDRIYDRAFIETKKLDAEFEREYNLKYMGKQGNVFPAILIDATVKRYTDLKLDNVPLVHEAMHFAGIDPAFGSSNTAIVITEHLRSPEVVRVVYSKEFTKANPQDIIDLLYKFHIKYYPNIRYYQILSRW